jgi:hypothetical protein
VEHTGLMVEGAVVALLLLVVLSFQILVVLVVRD